MGLIKGIQPVKITPKGSYRPYQRQYPLKPEAEEGIAPIIQDLQSAGVIRECPDAACNSPLFPVKKAAPSTGWRMVQDLRAVNKAVIPRAPLIPYPHMLLNKLNPKAKYFTVIYLTNAFFSVSFHKEDQFWFAFQYRGKKYTFTRLPQGYCESPTIFSMAMSSNLAQFTSPRGSQLLLYVDDILLASENEQDCKIDTIALFGRTGPQSKQEQITIMEKACEIFRF